MIAKLTMILCLGLVISMTGCEKDKGGGSNADVVGFWVGQFDDGDHTTARFEADGRVTWTRNASRKSGTYTVSGNSVDANLGDVFITTTVSGNTMTGHSQQPSQGPGRMGLRLTKQGAWGQVSII